MLAPITFPHLTAALNPSGLEFSPWESDGITALRLAPDGTMLAVITDTGEIGAIETESGTLIATTSVPFDPMYLDPRSVSWSPDQKHIAFSLNTWIYFVDSDIYVFALDTGELISMTTATDATPVATPAGFFGLDGVDIDLAPVWLSEDRIVFARTIMNGDNVTTTFQSVTLPDMDIQPWASSVSDYPAAAVLAPIFQWHGDTVVYLASEEHAEMHALTIQEGGTPTPVGLDSGELQLIDGNAETGDFIFIEHTNQAVKQGVMLVDIESGDKTNLLDLIEGELEASTVSSAACGSAKGRVAVLLNQAEIHLIEPDISKNVMLGTLSGIDMGIPYLQWAGDYILGFAPHRQWIINVADALAMATSERGQAS